MTLTNQWQNSIFEVSSFWGQVKNQNTKKAETPSGHSAFLEKLAATYSRGSYTTTTIGKTAFDGRVRNGIGSDHSFMATKVLAHGHRGLPAAQWVSLKD